MAQRRRGAGMCMHAGAANNVTISAGRAAGEYGTRAARHFKGRDTTTKPEDALAAVTTAAARVNLNDRNAVARLITFAFPSLFREYASGVKVVAGRKEPCAPEWSVIIAAAASLHPCRFHGRQWQFDDGLEYALKEGWFEDIGSGLPGHARYLRLTERGREVGKLRPTKAQFTMRDLWPRHVPSELFGNALTIDRRLLIEHLVEDAAIDDRKAQRWTAQAKAEMNGEETVIFSRFEEYLRNIGVLKP